MFDTYTLNLTNIVIILISSGVFYSFLKNIGRDEKDEKSFNTMIFALCLFLGFIVSLGISYLSLPEDKILTSNFWD